MTSGLRVFRQLTKGEEDAGYAVICDSVRWQKARGIDLWEQPLLRDTYLARQGRGENYAFFVGGELAVVASLVADVPAYWQSEVGNAKATWICTVATADRFHGQRAGEEAMKAALAYLAERGDKQLWLDCKPGMLERFYASLGFIPVARKDDILIPHASSTRRFPAVLMEYAPTGQDQPFNLRADAFAGTAKYYARFRPAYPAAMLDDLRARAGTTGIGKLLDLGCGPGRIAIPLAPHFGEVWAVDPEPEMIEVGREEGRKAGVTNIRWVTGRAEDLRAPLRSFELVTMGESFHRMDGPRILALVLQWLKPGGCLAALGVKDSGRKGEAPWQKALAEVWARWSRPGVAAGHPTAPPPGMRYGQFMAAAGFEDLGDLFVSVPGVWTVEDLIGNAYSTSVMSRQALGERVEAFEEDLRRTLLAIEPGGRFAETLVFIATLVRAPR